MLIVLIILTILAIVAAYVWADEEGLLIMFGVGALLLGVASVIMVTFIIGYYVAGHTADDKIKMYQEENTKIEADINLLVKEYMDYEQTTFTEVKGESATMLVSLFPELKSDTLVQEQIKIYTANNNKIKELKEDVIDMKIGKWLLYFGG